MRPGHFRGVATVVLKLLNMVQPDVAYFGQKDYQQSLVIRRMAADLDLPVAIRVCPIVREADGLAMSSRNRYLSPAARQRAVVLWRSLRLAAELVDGGETAAAAVEAQMRKVIETADDGATSITSRWLTLRRSSRSKPSPGQRLRSLAVRIENTRLIDNCLIGVRS